jgi:hypothetical protein
MFTRHLTFADLTTLIREGFDVHTCGPRPINISTPDHYDFYDFERIEPRIPGSDRMVRLTFYGDIDEFDTTQVTKPWVWSIIDRDDDGDTYFEYHSVGATLDEALTDIRAVPWTPPAPRLLELLRATNGEVTCHNGLLTFPNGTSIAIPTQESLES